jgi:mono/diheme cytochrome c family protein
MAENAKDLKVRIEVKATILAVSVSTLVLALTFSVAPFLRSSAAAESNGKLQASTTGAKPAIQLGGQGEQGRSLFARNCAHCHGDDARGDEGPTLYDLAMSDARIAKRIKEGIKGEMPKFGSKLNDMDIGAVIAYLRTLKD